MKYIEFVDVLLDTRNWSSWEWLKIAISEHQELMVFLVLWIQMLSMH